MTKLSKAGALGSASGLACACSALILGMATTGALAQAVQAAPTAAAPSSAQANSADSSAPGEIVVTAQKRAQTLDTVPLSLTAASGAKLTQLGITSANDLAKIVPGFTAVTGQGGAPVYYLRGVGFYDVSLSAKPAVTIYKDEAVLPYSAMSFGTTLDLERVEVLKGPQGLLFGANSTGGAINFIPAKPTSTPEMGGSISYGRFNDINPQVYVSGPIAGGVRGRVAMSYEYSGDWQKSYTRDDTNGGKKIFNGRLILDNDPSNRFRFRLTVAGSQDRSDSQALQLVGKDPLRLPYTPGFAAYPLSPQNARSADWSNDLPLGHDMRKNNSQFEGSLRMDYDVGSDITLTSLTSGVDTKFGYGLDADGTSLAITNFYISGRLSTIAQELRASGKFGSKGNWIVGGNFESDKTSETQNDDLHDSHAGNVFVAAFGTPPTNLVPIFAQTKGKSYAGFANAEYDILPHLKLHGGLRYTQTNLDFAGCARAGGNLGYSGPLGILFGVPPIASGDCATFTQQPDGSYVAGLIRNSKDEHNLSWRGGLDWTPIRGTMLYGSVSRGYKAAQFSDVAGVLNIQYVPVPQEKLTAYEVGIKTDIIPRVFHINAAVFYYDYRDKQLQGYVPVPIFGALQTLVSIPKSSVKGVEFDATLRPFQGLTISGGATYLRSKVISDYSGYTAFGVPANFKGSDFPNTPRFSANADIEYRWPMSSDLNAYLGASGQYRSKTDGDFNNNPDLFIKRYGLLDLRAGIEARNGAWGFQVWGRNVTNKYYWTSQTARLESIVRYAGMPATWGGTFSFHFK